MELPGRSLWRLRSLGVLLLLPSICGGCRNPPIGDPPVCTISTDKAVYQQGEPVILTFTLTSRSTRGAWIARASLPRSDPFEPEYFDIEVDGKKVAYEGAYVSYCLMDVPQTACTWLEPGGTIQVKVDLTNGFDLSTPGEYTVKFTGWVYIGAAVKDVSPVWPGQMPSVDCPSNEISLAIQAGPEKQGDSPGTGGE